MNKITMLAVAVAVVNASPVFAKESANIKVSHTKHHAAVAQGTRQALRSAASYNQPYRGNCVGLTIGLWKQGYPGTGNRC
jgi:hypothetical protein